jgi:hypothetical protein
VGTNGILACKCLSQNAHRTAHCHSEVRPPPSDRPIPSLSFSVATEFMVVLVKHKEMPKRHAVGSHAWPAFTPNNNSHQLCHHTDDATPTRMAGFHTQQPSATLCPLVQPSVL